MKGFGLKKTVDQKKVKQKVRYIFSEYGGYEAHFPIMDEKVKEELKDFKKQILGAINKASAFDKEQIINYSNAMFTIYPGNDESIIKEFKTNEW